MGVVGTADLNSGPAPFLRPLLRRPLLWLGGLVLSAAILVAEWFAMWMWATADVSHGYTSRGFVDDGGVTGDVQAIKIAFLRWALLVVVQIAVACALLVWRRRRTQ